MGIFEKRHNKIDARESNTCKDLLVKLSIETEKMAMGVTRSAILRGILFMIKQFQITFYIFHPTVNEILIIVVSNGVVQPKNHNPSDKIFIFVSI